MFFLFIYIIFSIFLSRSILKSNIFNLASISLIAYWAAYPFEKLGIDGNYDIYEAVIGIKEKGVYMYAIFGFSFLLGAFCISKINIKKINFYPTIITKNNLFFISTCLGLLGLFCFSNTYNFDFSTYFDFSLNTSRGEKMAILSKAKNALPYSIFFIPSITTLLITIKKFGLKNINNLFLSFIIFLINFPILFSYIFEGDRTALIKLLVMIIFTLGLTKYSVEKVNKNTYLIENWRVNNSVLKNRLKMTIILISLFSMLTIMGHVRGKNQEQLSRIFSDLSIEFKQKTFPVGEFRGVNYTIDYSLARNYINIEKTKKMFTWDKFIFYPLPTYVYKGIFKEVKPPNIGDAIGIETKNFYGLEDNRKLGFGLSPIAEGLINFGVFGVILNGFIYGLSINLLQYFYNKISLERINLLDIFILNTTAMVPLIMRAGSAGIYNWIFSTSFVILLPLLLLEILQKRNLIQIIKKKKK